jgi:hypothetical protein
MELVRKIELAPKNGDFIVLQDISSGSWEVGRWAPETSGWVQIDDKPVRIFPTHWVPISGETAGSEDGEGLPFLVPPIPVTVPFPRRRRTPLILAFMLAAIFIAGYAGLDFRFARVGPAKGFDHIVVSAEELIRSIFGERDDTDVFVSNTAAREEVAIYIRRADALQAAALEAKRIADAKQRELKQALDESEARAEALARDLKSVREITASIDKPFNENVPTQEGASPTGSPTSTTGSFIRSIKASHDVAGTTGVVMNPGLDELTEATPAFSAGRRAPLATMPNDPAIYGLRPPGQPLQLQPTNAISSADDARIMARAESLIKLSDFSGARLLLEHALEKGNVRAAFMMAETYDWRMLRS